MDKFIIYVRSIGYYTGKTFKYPNANKEDVFYPYTAKDPQKAKQYTSYKMALRGMKALVIKCDMPICDVKRLSECEVILK